MADLGDDLMLTIVPRLVGESGTTRITAGLDLDVVATPTTLLEKDGTLVGLWAIRR